MQVPFPAGDARPMLPKTDPLAHRLGCKRIPPKFVEAILHTRAHGVSKPYKTRLIPLESLNLNLAAFTPALKVELARWLSVASSTQCWSWLLLIPEEPSRSKSTQPGTSSPFSRPYGTPRKRRLTPTLGLTLHGTAVLGYTQPHLSKLGFKQKERIGITPHSYAQNAFRSRLLDQEPDAAWKRYSSLCHPERSRGICSFTGLSWKCF